jgi:glutaryl-CoA dehydrogenase
VSPFMNAPSPVPPDRGDFYELTSALPKDQQARLLDLRTVLETQVAPGAAQAWDTEQFPSHALPAVARLELAGAQFDGYGCAGLGELFTGLAYVEMARIDPSFAIAWGAHAGLAMGAVMLCGSEEQRQEWLPRMARMETVGSFALTEPDSGSDIARGMTTSARREGDTWVLNGQKKWIGNGTWCDVCVVWARDESDGRIKGFLVDSRTPGFTAEKMRGKLALRAVQNALITLQDCRVPESARLQNANSYRDTARVLRATRLMVCWQAAGCARGAFEHALAYATQRMQFDKPIGSYQLVQELLAKMLGHVTASLTMCARLAELTQDDQAREEQASLAKMHVTLAMRETVAMAREILGGNGIVLDYHVGRFFADAEAIYSFEGTHQINSLIVGRALTGVAAFT